MSTRQEYYRTPFVDSDSPGNLHVSYGLPFPEAAARHINGKRIGVLISGTLNRNTDVLKRLQTALGEERIVFVKAGMRPHTYWSEVLEMTAVALEKKPDVLVTLGAGSLTDAAKVIALAAENEALDFESLDTLSKTSVADPSSLTPASIHIVCIPTSLSGGEYMAGAGSTNDVTRIKRPFRHPSIEPSLVILDPELCSTTPLRTWLGSGFRAVDHCVEAICSPKSTPEGDESAKKGLRLLLPSLLDTKEDPAGQKGIHARLQSQLGVIESMRAGRKGIPMGASHGIGHQLGARGVAHGETSCIMLPAVLEFNASVNRDKQQKVLDVMWGEGKVVKLLQEKGLKRSDCTLSAAIDVFVRALALPRSLKEVGLNGKDIVAQLAEAALTDAACKSNPIPLEKPEQVESILNMVY